MGAVEQEVGTDIDVEVAGQKVNVKNIPSFQTLLAIFTLVIVSLIAYALWTHEQETKEAGQAFVSAIKDQTAAVREQTTVQREQNCLMRFDMKDRQTNADFCKAIAK